ncbi:MAG TPA: Flp pilus assembly protein CpaB [Bryobacteraceae bacterium]|nr:Flp pilus assembly protein CpaB [Bryobacteraceae bacterium]
MDRHRTILILAAAWIAAGLLSWFVYATAVAPRTEPQKLVIVAARDLALGTKLTRNDVKRVSLPERTLPKAAILQLEDAVGHVLLAPVSTNEPILATRLSEPNASEGIASTIDKGLRAVSVQITDVSGVAGLIQPKSRVDVIFTRPGSMDEASTSTILQDVQVLSTGRMAPSGQTAQAAAAEARAPRAPVVTLLLTPDQAQVLELAKNEGKISLSLRNPQDNAAVESGEPITPEVLDPAYGQRAAARRKRAPQPRRDAADDAAAWAKLAELQKKQEAPPRKEPEKPRVVVDVFRGDKHVQEQFK